MEGLPEQLVTGREAAFFGYEFAVQGGSRLSAETIGYYVDLLSNPDSLRGGFGWYRGFDATLAQNAQRKAQPLTMPVLAIGGASSYGDHVADAMKPIATDVQTLVISETGHWVAEDAPDQMLAALTAFLAPYRDGVVELPAPREAGQPAHSG